MGHTDDAYAAMLLTMALSPNKEEYARPLNAQEFRRVEAAARASRYHGVGGLLDVDISGLMIYLGIPEEEAYRVFTLLHRSVQLSYALEGYATEGIDVLTRYDAEYPRRLAAKLKDAAPPFLYRCGTDAVLNHPAIAILGISGVRTTPEAREQVQTLVRGAARMGYAVLTGGELGVARLTAGLVAEGEGQLAEVLGGDMHAHLNDDAIARVVGEGRGIVLSMEHPDALFTVSHAIARNRLLFALADAAFIFNTDGRRGETDALMNRACDWIYAWEDYPGNQALLSRGARPFRVLTDEGLEAMSRHWSSSSARQLNIFDML